MMLDWQDDCPACKHPLSEHKTKESGCLHGWTYGTQGGPALTDGCDCPLGIALQA